MLRNLQTTRQRNRNSKSIETTRRSYPGSQVAKEEVKRAKLEEEWMATAVESTRKE